MTCPFLPGSRPPERWDVVVFRYPEEPEVSYIKRLVGLPGETIRIFHGDIYIKPPGGDSYALARKPLRHQAAMQIGVYDDRHQPRAFQSKPEWRRWTSPDGWLADRAAVSAGTRRSNRANNGPSCGTVISCLSPSNGTPCSTARPAARPSPDAGHRLLLIQHEHDGRSSNRLPDESPDRQSAWMQPHWVGDLTLEADIDVTDCRPGARSGSSSSRAGSPTAARSTCHGHGGRDPRRRGAGPLADNHQGHGRHHVEFANVDDRMSLDGRRPILRAAMASSTNRRNRSRFRPRPTWPRRRSRHEMPRSLRATLS